MTDKDFEYVEHGATATITTNNWRTTQWLRENAPDVGGQVVGGVYATIVGEPRRMIEIAMALLDAGLDCANRGEILAAHA